MRQREVVTVKKRLYRVLITLTMTAALFCVSACGAQDTASKETSSEETEESTEESQETEAEPEKEETGASNEKVEDKVADGEYAIYSAFIKTFEINDNVLKVETEGVFEDYEIPTEMNINFEYPLAAGVVWIDDVTKVTEEEDWYGWFSFSLEGITKATQRYNNGEYEGTYASGEEFCKANAVWTFVIKDETVQSISMGLVKTETEATETETTAETQTTAEATPAPSAKEETPASTPAPVHTHSYNGTVTQQPTCGSNGVKTYTCSCGDSYTESISGGEHNWTPIYGTVEHPSMGEMRQVQVGTSGEVVVCNYCGAEFGDDDSFVSHKGSYVGSDNNHARASYTYRSGQPIYENQWVVTQEEAWSETVVTGYQCSICGATK